MKKFFVVFFMLLSITSIHGIDKEVQAVKKVWISKESDLYKLHIEFNHDIKFVPRIHTLAEGAKIFLTFNKPVMLPKTEIGNRGIIKGCFFEKFGTSSLVFVMALNKPVNFVKKTYMSHIITISFQLPVKKTIIIDAGHGGKDPGAKSPFTNYPEKNIVLVTAIELRNVLLNSNRYNVILTRDTDKYVSFDARRNIIDKSNGDFLISLHTDYNKEKTLRGMSVYTLPKQDNADDNDVKKSTEFAAYLTEYVPEFCKINNHACRTGDLKILKNAMPSVLIELGCISNKTDINLLLSHQFREKIIYAILYALDRFFEKGKK